MEILSELYPLTALQIGDIQSYVSWAFLYFAPISKVLLVLVDNRPWLMNNHSKSAKIWQLMVTKYRMSPFTNTRTLHKASETKSSEDRNEDECKSKLDYSNINRWFPAIDSTKWQEKYILPVMDLSQALHGFIVFEVPWDDVHGINYYNELQTDTSLALEVKSMKKWEFYSPTQASKCISSWFSGKPSEIKSLKKNLKLLSDTDLNANSSSTFKDTSSSVEVLSDDDFSDLREFPLGTDSKELHRQQIYDFDNMSILKSKESEEESDTTPSQYADTLILFRFDDSMLPAKLRQVIMSDLRLLTLVEAGLPSWVIFFQSYPLFCHFYRPWMRHSARTLYILISLVTVIIGFYDLYKNVPLLKETVARLGGPLFGWIEKWDMVSRIRYLGTMLFLQNLEKALRWFMTVSRVTKMIISAIMRPLMGPLSGVIEIISPLWSVCAETVEMFSSTVCFVIESTCALLLDILEVVLWPFEFIYSCIWSIGTSIYPMMCSIWELFLVPFRCLLTLAQYMSSLLSDVFYFTKDAWQSVSSISKVSTISEAKKATYDMSVWRALWNDLFSQVFRAIRVILNGLLTFLMTCNRHRLSIYNHIRVFLQRLPRLSDRAPRTCSCKDMDYSKECERCK